MGGKGGGEGMGVLVEFGVGLRGMFFSGCRVFYELLEDWEWNLYIDMN